MLFPLKNKILPNLRPAKLTCFLILFFIFLIFFGAHPQKAKAATITDTYGNEISGNFVPYGGTANNGKAIFLSNDGKSYYEGTGNKDYTPITDSSKIVNLLKDTEKTKTADENPAANVDSLVCSLGDFGCYLKRFVLWIANGFLWLFSWIVWLGAKLLDVSLDMPRLLGGFTKAPIVTIGWPIVRDLANMFFSLILLVIAFATILRIESYGMKQILWRLVVAALLINFSLVIAGVIIDGSNVLTNFFVKGNFVQENSDQPADISSAILNGLQLHLLYDTTSNTIASMGNNPAETKMQQGEITYYRIFLNVILGIIFMLVTAFVLLAAAILFFIRLVVLWILLIFAPLAWLAMILPGTRNLWNKWWSEFMKWIIFAPVYGFFIYLTVSMINNGLISKMFGQNLATVQDEGLAISAFTATVGPIINYIIIIAFMVAGLIFARSTGIAGAGAMANLGTSMRKGATGWAGRFVDRSLARQAEAPGWRKGLSYLSPTAWKQGIAKRRAQQEREAFEVAGGARQDSLNRFFSRKWGKKGAEMTEYADRAKRARRQTERREITSNNAEELVGGFEKAKSEKNYSKMAAYAQALSEQNDFNELIRHYAAKGEEGTWEMSAEGMEHFVNQKLVKETGMDKQDALRLGYDLLRMHEANGQWLGRMIKYDGKNGLYAWEDQELKDASGKVIGDKYDNARNNATIEWSKQDPQAQARTTGRFSLIKERYGAGGVTIDGGLTNAGKKMIGTIGGEHANRVQRHTRNVMMLNHAKEVEQYNPDLYEKTVGFYQNATDKMDDEQYAEYVATQQTYIGIIDEKTGKRGTPVWARKKSGGTEPQQQPPTAGTGGATGGSSGFGL